MDDFKERLLEKVREEAIKLQNLNKFMAGDIFPGLSRVEKDLLYQQSRCMNQFVQILGKRLEFYNIQFSHKKEEK